MVVSPNPNLLLLVQLISGLADTFGLFLISREVSTVEAMDESEGPPPRKRGRPFTTGKIGGGAYCSAVGCHNNEGRDRAWSCVVLQLGIVGSCCWTVGKKHGDNIYIIKLWQILLNMLKINLISAIFTNLRVLIDKKFPSNIITSVVASICIGIRNMSLPGEPTLWQP